MSISTSRGAPGICASPFPGRRKGGVNRYNSVVLLTPQPLRTSRLPALAATFLLAFSVATAEAQKKVLRIAFPTAETGFDPQRIDDRYSVGVCENLFEPLLTYDYLARPARLVPLTAEAIPEPDEGGTRYTFRIKPGIYFADDLAFKGKKRELTAEDYVFSLKQIGRAHV